MKKKINYSIPFWVDVKKQKYLWGNHYQEEDATSPKEINKHLDAQFRYFVKKKLENCPEIVKVKSKIDEIETKCKEKVSLLISQEEGLIKTLSKVQNEVFEKWKNDPEMMGHLRLEFKKERALKVLKKSIRK